jgi:hypothetical protein
MTIRLQYLDMSAIPAIDARHDECEAMESMGIYATDGAFEITFT